MKHRHSMRKLGRTSSHRWALLRNLVSQLVQHERLETTVAKAKELRRVADNLAQLGPTWKAAAGVIQGDENLHKVFSELALHYKVRQGDAAAMAFIEFVDCPNELRESKPPCSPPPLRLPLPPWVQYHHARQWAPMSSGL
ncbi:hypothetical protein BDL97_10G056900 [Sphagnum fallax]|nr:hypothetical protein BDL97_10G056900 [Sphagnum fallax]